MSVLTLPDADLIAQRYILGVIYVSARDQSNDGVFYPGDAEYEKASQLVERLCH